jgi:hypothetical protein
MTRFRVAAAVLALSLAWLVVVVPPAHSQGADSIVVRGLVYDSLLTGRPLAGAEVWIEGTNRTARTNATGRFEFSGLPAGRYTLTFYHPILDSTGLSAPPVVANVTGGDLPPIQLATPSPATVHRVFCPRDDSLTKVGVLLGMVREAPGGTPIAEVMIQAEWTAYILGGGTTRAEPRTAATRSDAAGRVVLCGVPTDVAVVIRGQIDAGPEGMLVVDLAGRRFGAGSLHLSRTTGSGTVSGTLKDLKGSVVPGAIILVVGTDRRARSDARGVFTVRDVLAGSRILEARAIGFHPARATATVQAGGTTRLEMVVGDSVQVLETITVEGEYQPYLAQVGFTRRRGSAQGHYLDEHDIDRTGAVQFEEVFRMVPGVRLRPSASGYLVELQRGQGQALNPRLANYCAPSYFIDGVYYPLPPLESPTLPLVPEEVLGIEIYSNIFSAPQQYQRRDGACGIILIWTKRGLPNKNR